jgi:glycosyltransferase involved in cell wall biosynthesis
MARRLLYISDQVFYWDGDTWYTSNGFPLREVVDAAGGAIGAWTFFGRLLWVKQPPEDALPVRAPVGLDVSFVGPWLNSRGIGGYIRNLPVYIRLLRKCIGNHDVVWVKANFVAAWLALPFLWRASAFRISHQVGDPARIAACPQLLRPVIRLFAAAMTRLVHRVANINVFVSRQLSDRYGRKRGESWICNESRIRPEQIIDPVSLPLSLHRPLRLLYVGRFSPEKGVPVLLRAVTKLAVDYELRLVGCGRQQGELELLVSDLGINDKVQFCGAEPWGEALFTVIRSSDILILPSYTEGLGLVLLEAMSQGVPVVASNVGGIPEIVNHGVSGLLFPVGDADALAREIGAVAGDALLRNKLRTNALQVARQNTLDGQLCKMFAKLAGRMENARFCKPHPRRWPDLRSRNSPAWGRRKDGANNPAVYRFQRSVRDRH